MVKKPEEREWSEIIAEVRAKAKSEAEEAAEDIRSRVETMVEKVRAANFHEEAEQFLAKVRKLADEFSRSEDGPTKSKASKGSASASDIQYDKRGIGYRLNAKGGRVEARYLDDSGRQHTRPPRRADEAWTEAEKKRFRQNFINKFHEQ